MKEGYKKVKRSSLLKNFCCRCGNDLMTGRAVLHLPYCKTYISLCSVCAKGLNLELIFQKTEPTNEQWASFWDEEIEVKE